MKSGGEDHGRYKEKAETKDALSDENPHGGNR